jgi:predicted site-specific integrase-resolvase
MGISRTTFWRYVRAGRLRTTKTRPCRVSVDDIEALLHADSDEEESK